jgi:hypothetical protein
MTTWLCTWALLLSLVATATAVTLDVTASPYNAACDNATNDAAAIQAAFNALPVQGGTVTFPAGRLCGVGSAGVVVQDRHAVILEGLGAGAGFKALAPGPLFGGYGPTMVRLLHCADCEVRRLTFEGSAQVTNLLGVGASDRVKVVGNTLRNCNHNGALVVYGNTDNLYTRNTVDTQLGTSRAFWIGNVNPGEEETRATVADNMLTAGGGTAIVVWGSAQVVRNTLDGTGNTNGAGMAISCTTTARAHDVLIRSNTITGFAYQGIQSDCINDGDYSLNIQVIGNTIRATPGNGIYIVRARQWTVRDNVIEDVGLNGILVSNARRIRLEGNRITDTRTGGARTVDNGIHVIAQSNVLDVVNVRMEANSVSNVTGHGIQVVNAAPGTMTDIRMVRNVLLDNDGYGIFVADVADGDITHVVATQNVTQRNAGGDIRMDPSDGVIN